MGVAGAVLLAAALFGSTALAQGVSVITGKVSDASTHQAVADVVVTATSPNLQGEQIVVTDNTGSYRVPQLPPGVYTIRFEKEGYHPYVREGITLRPDVTIRVDVDLLPEAIQAETVVVVGRPPTVDVGSSSQGADIGQNFVNNLALSRPGGTGGASRGFESLALAVPQAQSDLNGVSISGATSAENSFLVDGVSVNNPAFGINSSGLPIEFLDDVNVLTGGYMPEFGRATGGTLSATTKSGGNEFHGQVWINLAPGAFAHDPKTIPHAASSLTATLKPFMIGDIGATIGGPIMKDKLWFFAGIAPAFSRYSGEMSLTPIVNGTIGATPVYTRRSFVDDRIVTYIAKLTYALTQDHRLSLSWNGTNDHSGGNGSYPFGTGFSGNPVGNPLYTPYEDYSAVSKNTAAANDLALKLNSAFLNKKVLLDVTLGWHHQVDSILPNDGSYFGNTDPNADINQGNISWDPSIDITQFPGAKLPASVIAACTAPGASCPVGHGGWVTGGASIFDFTMNAYEAKATATYFMQALGHHTWKAGADVDVTTYHTFSANAGGLGFTYDNGDGTFIMLQQYGKMTGPDQFTPMPLVHDVKNVTAGGFLQDSWSVADLVTLNLGVRYDQQSIYNSNGDLSLKLSNEWSPRIGLIFDPTHSGRSKIYVNYAKYYEDVPLDLADRSLSGQPEKYYEFFANPGGNCKPGMPASNCINDSTAIPIFSANPNHSWASYATVPDQMDANISPPGEDEIVAGVEYEIIDNGRLALNYTHRQLDGTVEDMSLSNAATFFMGNPGSGAAAGFPKATRIYNAGTISFTKAFANNWMVQASYTLSRLFGDYEGPINRTYGGGQLDPNITESFDLPQLLVNSNGRLTVDQTHSIKLFAAKEFPITGNVSVTLGGSWLAHSGFPLSVTAASSLYGSDAIYLLPRGTYDHLPWYQDIDGHLSVNVKLSKGLQLSAYVDAFNLFNIQRVTSIDTSYTLSPHGVLPIPGGTLADLPKTQADDGSGTIPASWINPNFQKINGYQDPRSFRLGVKLTY